ncbi:hypothetical protein ACWKWA_00890 [Dermacoccus abyssi]
MQLQVVIGLALGGWRTYSWGWAAPAVRREARGRAALSDNGIRIISDAPTATDDNGSESAAGMPAEVEATEHDPIKIITGSSRGEAA